MKRPLAIVGFTYLFTLIAASYLNLAADAALAGIFLLFAAVMLLGLRFIRLRREIITVFISAALLCCGISL